MSQSAVILKSNPYGLVLNLNSDLPFEELRKAVGEKFRESAGFFKNAKLALTFRAVSYTHLAYANVRRILPESLNLALIEGIEAFGHRIPGFDDSEACLLYTSQVEMITKTAGSLTGVRYVIEGGVEKSLEEIGAPEGTTFLVHNLFYNTPARKKFLKSASSEAGYVSDLLERMALSHPNISFKFISNRDTCLLYTSSLYSLCSIQRGELRLCHYNRYNCVFSLRQSFKFSCKKA